MKELKEDGASVPESSESNAPLAHQHHDEEQPPGIAETQGEDVEIPELSLPMTIGLLIVVTVLVAITAEWLVDSIDGLANTGGISKEFIGLILLPIVGNAAEHVSAVTVSIKDKLTLSISVAVGSSIVSSLLPFWRDVFDSLSYSKLRCLLSHSPSSLAGSWVVRLRCSSTHSNRSYSSSLS